MRNNLATFRGGGLASGGGGSGQHVTLTNCTFANNQTQFSGGGLWNDSSSTLNLTNVTVTANTTTNANAGVEISGTVVAINTIVAGNTKGSAASDVGGSFNMSSHHNLIGTGGSGGLTNGVNGNIIGVQNPHLGSLASNGGPTQTIALQGSTAVNAGATVAQVTTDQRGVARPQNGAPDIGAYEFSGTITPSLVVTTTTDELDFTSDPTFGAGTSLREALNYAQLLGGAQTITFDPSLAGQTVTLTTAWDNANSYNSSSAMRIDGNITVQGPTSAPGITLKVADTAQLRHFVVSSGGTLVLQNLTLTGGKATLSGFDFGGAVWNFGTLAVRNCTFTGNTAGSEGGAIQSWGDSPSLLVENSTVAGNHSNDLAGAIDCGAVSMTFRDVTISNNTAANGGNAVVIYQSQLTMVNSLIGGNGNEGVGSVNGGTFSASSTNNILSSATAPGLTNGVNANQLGVPVAQLKLGSLADNGGPTQTIALLNGSPALNAGTVVAGLTSDQRGVARPQGANPDVGAFEARIVPPPTFSVTNVTALLSDPAFDLGTASGASPSGGSFAGPGVSGANFDPAAAANGVHTITYTVMSSDGISASGTFTVTVNQPAAITSGSTTTFTVGTNGSFQLSASGFPATYVFSNTGAAMPNGVTLSSGGLLSGTPADGTGGVYNLTFKVTNGVAPDGTQSFTLIVNEAPEFTSASTKAFTVGVAGTTHQLLASGFPSTFTFTNSGAALPSGLSLSSTGLLSGTPNGGTGGVYHLIFQASNGINPVATQSFTLTVNQALAFTSANETTFTVGTNGSFNVTATGFPAPTFSTTDALPNGVTLSPNGTLSGTPMPGTGGVYTLTITASNGGSDATQTFTLTVNQAPAVTSANSATFTVGNTGGFTVQAAGFPVPTLSESGALPTGLTFTPETGILAGTPAAGTAGNYPITFTATNGVGSDAAQTFTLTVNEAVCVAPPADLIAWYPGEGDATDVKGGIHGTPVDGAGFAAGKAGQGFTFDGGTAVVQVPDNDAWDFGANAFTIETWVKFNAVSGSDVLVAHSESTGAVNKWIFWLHNGALEFHLNGSAVANITSSATFTPAIGQWHHVALTRSGNTYKFYIDGAQHGSDRFDGNSVPNATAPLTFGKVEALPAINGMLDEVQIFGRALSGPEIQSVYNASTEGFCTDTLQTVSAVSRKTHGSAGDFDVPLPFTGAPGVECRSGGANGDHTIVLTFNNVVTGGTATVNAGSVSGTPTFTLNTMKVNLTGVPNAQTLTITLNNVKDGFGQTLPNLEVPMNVLLGDTNGNKSVTASDISQTKAQSGNAARTDNFRTDLNGDGSITSSDISIVKAAAGTLVP
jgi:hypothetical protein